MATTKRYTVERGAYQGTTDDRIDRWYIRDNESTAVDRRGPGFALKREAQEEADWLNGPDAPTSDEIRDWRSRLGWTQEEASSALGLARRHLSDLETGNRNAQGYLRLAMERLEDMHG